MKKNGDDEEFFTTMYKISSSADMTILLCDVVCTNSVNPDISNEEHPLLPLALGFRAE